MNLQLTEVFAVRNANVDTATALIQYPAFWENKFAQSGTMRPAENPHLSVSVF